MKAHPSSPLLALSAVLLPALLGGCSRSEAATRGADDTGGGGVHGECSHATCADNYFIDAAPPAPCAVGATCSVTLKLVATGDYHINDEYPYRFKADDAADIEFLGTDSGGKNVFSKTSGDWQKA